MPPAPSAPRIALIAAMAKNRVIGVENRLPWQLPADLRHFKTLTMGHHIIMGRKTFDSIGRPLPGRTTVIVSRRRDYEVPGCVVAHSVADAVQACGDDPEVFFVGGAELYAQALAVADRIYLTEIQAEFPGDACFPEFAPDAWQETERVRHQVDGPGGLEYHFVTYDRLR